MKSGPLCTPNGLLNHICYEVGIRELIDGGYLCPLVSKAGKTKVDTSTLHVRCGEFASNEAELLMNDNVVVAGACREIVELTRDRHAVLLFASGIYHGQHLVRVLQRELDIECGFITGETASAKREQLIARFKSGDLKYLCNVNVLTTGFDVPHVDCVALLRPTISPGLLYQMVGRGLRIHPSKQNCLVLDFAGNILRLGPIDQLRIKERSFGSGQAPVKECPECQALIATGYSRCPECGYEFPAKQQAKHETQASEASVLSVQVTLTQYPVEDIYYRVHRKAGASEDAQRTLNVIYKVCRTLRLLLRPRSSCLKGQSIGQSGHRCGCWRRCPSRAADTHLILRPHEVDDVVVLEAAVRSWPPQLPICLRWTYPVWTPDSSLDPTLLRQENRRRTATPKEESVVTDPPKIWTPVEFVEQFVTSKPRSRVAIFLDANDAGTQRGSA